MEAQGQGAIAGIDIAKQSMDVTLVAGKEQFYAHFANNDKGIEQLLSWLLSKARGEVYVCMEATNVYWEAAATALYDVGYRVSVVNPRRIKGFAMSQMQRNKTDKLDSEVIAGYCAAMQPDGWTPPNETQSRLRALQRHYQDLQKNLTQHKNRRDTVRDADVKASLQRVIEGLQGELKALEKKMAEVSAQCQAVQEQKQLLLSVTGIGEKSAHLLLAEMYNMAEYKDARAVAADAGVTPAHYDSGTTVHRRPKLSKVGKASVRGQLYMPALNAMRTNPPLRTFAERLRANGKPEPVIIGAVIRKLLHICYGVLKNKTPFDPNYGLSRSMA